MSVKSQKIGYLPDEVPSLGKLLLYALQQVIVMFPATITVALITGFQVSTTIFASGLATLCFILITKRRIPLYYGSSFAYLSAVSSMAMAEGSAEQIAAWQATGILPPELISKVKSPTASILTAKSCLLLLTVWVEITAPFRLMITSAFMEAGLYTEKPI